VLDETAEREEPSATDVTASRPDGEVLRFSTAADFEAWLEANQDGPDGVWLLIARKGSPGATVSYPEALEIALSPRRFPMASSASSTATPPPRRPSPGSTPAIATRSSGA
jgi:hypothetical protein